MCVCVCVCVCWGEGLNLCCSSLGIHWKIVDMGGINFCIDTVSLICLISVSICIENGVLCDMELDVYYAAMWC